MTVATASAEETRAMFLARMDREIEHALAPHIESGVRCAYLDWPNHGNVGDSALWLAGKRYLLRAGAEIAYASDFARFSARDLQRLVGDRTVYLAGGGNLGDIWLQHQDFRERVLTELPRNRIVQLPQSVYFEHPRRLAQAKAVFEAHRSFTLLVRERRSLDFCRSAFDVPVALCPDLALGLNPVARTTPATVDILWLARTNAEAVHGPIAAPGVEIVDWPGIDPPPGRAEALARRAWGGALEHAGDSRVRAFVENAVRDRDQDRIARDRLADGYRLLSRGRVVVSDRLHVHVFACLLGIPHVLLDNSYGKVRAVYDTWTSALPLGRWSDSSGEALALARQLVARNA